MTPADLARILAASYRLRRHAGRLLSTEGTGGGNTASRKSAFLLAADLRKLGHACDEAGVLAALEALQRDGLVARRSGGFAVCDWDALRVRGTR